MNKEEAKHMEKASVALSKTIAEQLDKNEKSLQALGRQIIKDTVKLASKYLEVCQVIRVGAIPPKRVKAILNPLGFNKARVSEINRVANAPEVEWKRITALQIGWKGAVDIVRGSEVEVVAKVEWLKEDAEAVFSPAQHKGVETTGAANDAQPPPASAPIPPILTPDELAAQVKKNREANMADYVNRIVNIFILNDGRKKEWKVQTVSTSGACEYTVSIVRGAMRKPEKQITPPVPSAAA